MVSTGIATEVETSTEVSTVLPDRPIRPVSPLPQEFYDQCILCNSRKVTKYPLGEMVISFKRDKKSDLDDCIGLIGRNQDMIAFVNEKGDYYCMPKSNFACRTLIDHGYCIGELEIKLEIGHTILDDPILQERFQILKRQCRAGLVAIST